MRDHILVFLHSPLVGPLTWQAVAGRFTAAGYHTVVPDLTGAIAGPAPYLPRIGRAVAAASDPLGAPAVLVGHSGAGPLLPGVAGALAEPVRALVYVDAGLPYPDQTWFERAPADLVDHLRALTTDGWLPPWHEWFPPAAVAGLLPDPALLGMPVVERISDHLAMVTAPDAVATGLHELLASLQP